MTLRSFVVAFASCASSLLLVAGTARAITLPDSGSCSSSGDCLFITNADIGDSFHAKNTAFGRAIFAESANATGLVATTAGVSGLIAGVVAVASGTGYGVFASANSNVGVYANSTSNDGVRAYTNNANAAGVSAINNVAGGLAIYGGGNIQITGSAIKPGGGSWVAPSDARIKKDVNPLQWGLEELREVRPVTYKYNGLGGTDDDGRMYVGVVAQELEKVFPTMVSSRKGKLHAGDAQETDIKVVDPSAFTYVLINAVKEQQEIIERQEHRIAALEHPRRAPLAASVFGGGFGTGLAISLVSLGFVVQRRRKESKSAS